jgi:glucokinase
MSVIAVDAGGTNVKLAVVRGGVIVDRTTIPAHSDQGMGQALDRMAPAIRRLSHSDEVVGLGMAFPSLTKGNRVIGNVGKFVDASDFDLEQWSEREFGLPFALENDARTAAIGEWRHGSARGHDNLVMITLGTGIGTGVIIGGSPLRGTRGAAGILGGHMTAKINGRLCACGNLGCFETEASTAALREMADAKYLDYEDVFKGAEDGEPKAAEILDHSIEVWSALAVSLIHAYDPEIVVFGGGVMTSGNAILGPVAEFVARHAHTPCGPPKIVASALGDAAALFGCEWLIQEKL